MVCKRIRSESRSVLNLNEEMMNLFGDYREGQNEV